MYTSTAGMVSAIVVAHNQGRFVADALASVASQTYEAMQVIVVDDASRDGTQEMIREWATRRPHPVDLVFNHRRLGLLKSLNLGLRRATGEYLALLAADDRWEPEKTALQVAMFASLPQDYGVIYGDAVVIDEDGHSLGRNFIEGYRSLESAPDGDIFCALVEGNFIPAMSCMIRRTCISEVGLADEGLAYEDWDLWLRLARRYRFAFCDQPLASYRVVAGSLSKSLPQAEWAASEIDILRKHKDADCECMDLIRSRIVRTADYLFDAAHPRSVEFLRLALDVERTPRRAIKWLAARAGLSAAQARRLRRPLRADPRQ